MNSSRTPIIAANWKMFKTIAEAVSFTQDLQKEVGPCTDREVVIAPPFTALQAVRGAMTQAGFFLSAQNCHWEEKGAFTGEISPVMLTDIGCEYVIIGHSERRHIFDESNDAIRQKVASALAHGIKPILCVGETLKKREDGKTFQVVDKQMSKALEGVDASQARSVVVAYEPVWAIGTGKTAGPEQAQEVHAFIRERFESIFDKDLANSLRILYGGSVKPDNVDALIAQTDIDGMLVGGASLEVSSFRRIVQFQA